MNLKIQCIEAEHVNGEGYGQGHLQVGPGKYYGMLAHRIAFERAWSIKLKPGQVVRHTCDNPGCVNPLHLQLGTPGDNNRDTSVRGRHRNQHVDKTHCINGHEFTEANTYHHVRGGRQCKTCTLEGNRRRRG